MLKKTFAEGFTLVELSLSMVFISILSLSIVLIINNTLAAYRRGLTLSQINTMGMSLVDDIRAAAQSSSVQTLEGSCSLAYSGADAEKCKSDNAYGLVLVKKMSNIMVNGDKEINVPIYGAFCTGTYSYIWNSGYFDSADATFVEKNDKDWAKLRYKTGEKDGYGDDVIKEISSSIGDENKPFRLLKVEDGSYSVCASMMGSSYRDNDTINNVVNLGKLDNEPEDILVADNNNNLALYDLDAAQPVKGPKGNDAFYSGSFILGTISGGVNVMARGNSCATPAEYENADFDYCAINKFNFAVQVNRGGKNGNKI